MMSRILYLLMLLCCSGLLASSLAGQTKTVKVKFEVDGKEVHQKFRILLYAGDEIIEPRIVQGGFTVPPEIRKYEKVGVRFLSEDDDLFFESVYLSKFETDWVVGIDRKSFASENVSSSSPGSETKLIYYINFISKDGDGTRMVVEVHE